MSGGGIAIYLRLFTSVFVTPPIRAAGRRRWMYVRRARQARRRITLPTKNLAQTQPQRVIHSLMRRGLDRVDDMCQDKARQG